MWYSGQLASVLDKDHCRGMGALQQCLAVSHIALACAEDHPRHQPLAANPEPAKASEAVAGAVSPVPGLLLPIIVVDDCHSLYLKFRQQVLQGASVSWWSRADGMLCFVLLSFSSLKPSRVPCTAHFCLFSYLQLSYPTHSYIMFCRSDECLSTLFLSSGTPRINAGL